MNHLSDEIINDFIDGTLDSAGIKLLKEHKSICPSCAARINSLHTVHNKLYSLKEYQPSGEFENKVMRLISAGLKKRKEKNYFPAFIIGTFVTSIALLIGLIAIGSNTGTESSSPLPVNSIVDTFLQSLSPLQSLINAQNLTFAGMIITLIIFISAYFFFDSHKAVKHRLSKVNIK